MRLLSKTSLLIITASIFIFWIGNIAFFFVSREMISQHINAELLTQMNRVNMILEEEEKDPRDLSFIDEISISVMEESEFRKPVFSDTVLFSDLEKRYIPHRALMFTHQYEDHLQSIIIYKSLLASDKLIERITLSSIILVISFIIMIYVLNRYIFANVWSSFSDSLERVENYDIKSQESLSLPGSEIDEFDKLNRVLLEMVERIQNDYRSLKELTANTSHEIQTPLAIIKSKAELLLQSDNLGETEMETIGSILSTTERLSKLNQSLLLIAKIENNQFEETETVDLKEAIEKYIESMGLLFTDGGFRVRSSLISCSVSINHILLDVLISNLLKNALSHGTRGGEIIISLEDCVLTVSNSGEPLSFPTDLLFKRFIKGADKKGSTGIGLEIVRKICSYYQIIVGYSYDNSVHNFSVDFSRIFGKNTSGKKKIE